MAGTFIELNSRNLEHNLRQFKNIAPQSELWPVVKSNAYGHGLKEIVGLLNNNPLVSGLLVVNLEEALFVSTLSQKSLMVLSYFDFDDEQLKSAIEKKIILPIYNFESFEYLQQLAKKLNKQIAVSVKIDSGTNRLGFKKEDEPLVSEIMSSKYFQVHSIYTHFAESEASNLDFTQQQLKQLLEYKKKYSTIKLHVACSAAAIGLPETRLDILRLGLALYGLWPSHSSQTRGQEQKMDLRPILSLKTKIIQIKNIVAGESIGYNRTFVADSDLKIAVLPIGYYEGLPRLLSNNGQVLIRGQRCQIRGNICMNLSMVELAKGLDAKVGDEVVIIGQSGSEHIGAEELAIRAQSINYEILARLNPNLKRIIV
ncbi:MAG: alanine racemase [Patescibacteria group bacterium]|jgi:alanine racemase